jgi:oxygen-dependent protoporphyrinogen oxidase
VSVRIAVVGGGISGLTLAYRLRESARALGTAVETCVLEAASRPGGHATTLREDGYVVDGGPNGFLDRASEPHVRALVRELGLESRLVEASRASRRRYVLLDGRLRRVPDSPPGLLTSDALTPAGKLRLLMEPFVAKRRADPEETVFDFACRRVGRQAAERLVDAAVTGISAGDSRELAVAAAFPIMAEMEREHGSLMRAMIARRRTPAPRLRSFEDGLGALSETLAARLGPAVRTGAIVRSLRRVGSGWRLVLESGETVEADQVALSVASHRAAGALADFDPELGRALDAIPFAGVAVVALSYPRAAIARPLDGYGYLVGRDENLGTLGVVWESTLFPARAPADHVLLRCMLGGTRHPDLVDLPTSDLVQRAIAELTPVLGVRGAPERSWSWRWPRAIAQYTRGHDTRVARARALAARHPGLELLGTSYDGISLTAAIASAERAAIRLLATHPASTCAETAGVPV